MLIIDVENKIENQKQSVCDEQQFDIFNNIVALIFSVSLLNLSIFNP